VNVRKVFGQNPVGLVKKRPGFKAELLCPEGFGQLHQSAPARALKSRVPGVTIGVEERSDRGEPHQLGNIPAYEGES
jgi:hypothetical protein